MPTPRTSRRRAAPRSPPGVALRVACLVLGFAAVALTAAAALAPREPTSERSEAAGPSMAAVTGASVVQAAPLPHDEISPSPSRIRVPPVAQASSCDTSPSPSGAAPRPGTERAFYEQDLRLAARPGALAERARQLFRGGEGSDRERVAALRALWDSRTPGAETWYALALRPPPDAPAPRGTLSVGEFALGFLHERAAREPAALELLAQLAGDVTAPRSLRRSAALSVAATGDAPQLRRLATDIAGDDDPDFRAALAKAAALNDAAQAASLFTTEASCYGPSIGATDARP
jgi:hypothetical protein